MWPFTKKKEPLQIETKTQNHVVRNDSFVNYITGFGTDADKGAASRVAIDIPRLEYSECSSLYRNNGYARTYADIYPYEATRKGWHLDGIEEEDPLLDVIQKFEEDFSVYDHVKKALTYGGVFGRGAILIITKDVRNEQSLREPLPDRPGEILSLIPLECREELVADTIDNDIRSKTFLQPILWRCQPKSSVGSVGQFVVHSSRLIFFRGAEVTPDILSENQGIEDSIFQAAHDALRQISTVDQALTAAANELQFSVFKVSGLESQLASDTEAEFINRMKELSVGRSVFRTTVIKTEEEFDVKQLSVSGTAELKDSAKEALCAVTRIPMPIYFGLPPGGLNADGESHRATWFESISAYQNEKLLKPLTRLYSIFLTSIGKFSGTIKIVFNPLEELSELQQATIENTKADARKKNVESDSIQLADSVISQEYIWERDDIDIVIEPKDEGEVDEKLLGED